MGEVKLENRVNDAWLTAMLTATGTNAPKSFPTSPGEVLKKLRPPVPMNKGQWEAMFAMIFAARGENSDSAPQGTAQN